jgi:hypothetical protein
MQLTNTPAKLVLPFANAGAKNTIPTASQIGITAGAASLVDGFPPLTRTPIAAGGVPPSGLDMNGILFELSAILRWANAGGGYAFDGAFAADNNVGGYPKGARIMRSDGLGYWFNTVENNTTDPENTGANVAANAGWVPDYTNGVTTVAMASANVTLTPVQYGKPVIVITGTLTANLNLIFPTIVNEWTVINNTTGAFTITCKTAAGTGLVVNTAALIVGDGTNIQSAITDAAAIFGGTVSTATGGTADAITAIFAPAPRYPSNGVCLSVRAASANATTTPTFTPNSGVIAQATIVKGNNLPLAIGDISGAGHWLELAWDSTLLKWVLLNPATGVVKVNQIQPITASVAANALTLTLNPTTLDFRSSSLNSGAVNTRRVASAISLTIPSGATINTVSGQQARLVLLAVDNAGTVELAVANVGYSGVLDESGLISTTAISGASSNNGPFSTNARTNVPYRVVGFVDVTEATAGTWATAPSTVQGIGGQALAALSSVGYCQSWQDLVGSRSAGTTYYNTTGRPIQVCISAAVNTTGALIALTVNGVSVIGNGGYATNAVCHLSAIVPPGATYVLGASGGTVSAIAHWCELR